MAFGLIGALVLAVGFLAAARYLSSPLWIDALVGTGASLGLVGAFVVGLALRRLLGVTRWLGPAALVLAVSAAVARAQLLARVMAQTPSETGQIDFARLTLAASTVVWGAVGLVWGTLALGDSLEPRRRRYWGAVLGGVAVAVALYCLAPLWYLAGLRINHWTVLGLFGLAAVAYGMGQAWRRLRRRTTEFD